MMHVLLSSIAQKLDFCLIHCLPVPFFYIELHFFRRCGSRDWVSIIQYISRIIRIFLYSSGLEAYTGLELMRYELKERSRIFPIRDGDIDILYCIYVRLLGLLFLFYAN